MSDSGSFTRVELQPTGGQPTDDQALWVAIRNRTKAIDYGHYEKFINSVFSAENNGAVDESSVSKAKLANLVAANGQQDQPRERGNTETVIRGKYKAKFQQLGSSTCGIPIHGPHAYQVLKFATEAFLMVNTGLIIKDMEDKDLPREAERLGEASITKDELQTMLNNYFVGDQLTGALPYYQNIINALIENVIIGNPYQRGILKNRFNCPSMLELIWSYWLEEGMLVQTMNAITTRFQNRRNGVNDPLVQLELDPLHPLNNLIWGFVQDENHRLSIPRRAYEYDHHYGFKLVGKAIKHLESADSRSNFIKVFHNLLNQTAIFHQERRDTTIYPDGFPLLNAIRDVHMQLSEGMHNQYGDLPTKSRVEMLMTKWLLARPEMREFLRGRHMVRYNEPWMGAVDAMKKLQGWSDVSVTHFRNLAVYGERILLSLRFADWIDDDNNHNNAINWAEYWRTEVQGYNHAYKAITGVDLAIPETRIQDASLRYAQPSLHLSRRLEEQVGKRSSLPSPTSSRKAIASEMEDQAEWMSPPLRHRLPRYRKDE